MKHSLNRHYIRPVFVVEFLRTGLIYAPEPGLFFMHLYGLVTTFFASAPIIIESYWIYTALTFDPSHQI
jgi:hypothetical protein